MDLIQQIKSSGSDLISALQKPRSFPLANAVKPAIVPGQYDPSAQPVTGSMLQGPIDSQLSTGKTNFGNLENRGQPDALPINGRFASFPSPLEGAEALARDIHSKVQQNPNVNLAQIISIYAPPNENNTKKYINDVAARLGVKPTTAISDVVKNNLKNLIISIGMQEGVFGNGEERKMNIKKFSDTLLQYGLKGFGAGKQTIQ